MRKINIFLKLKPKYWRFFITIAVLAFLTLFFSGKTFDKNEKEISQCSDPHNTYYWMQSSRVWKNQPKYDKSGYSGEYEDKYDRVYKFDVFYKIDGIYDDIDTTYYVRIDTPNKDYSYTFSCKDAEKIFRYCQSTYEYDRQQKIEAAKKKYQKDPDQQQN